MRKLIFVLLAIVWTSILGMGEGSQEKIPNWPTDAKQAKIAWDDAEKNRSSKEEAVKKAEAERDKAKDERDFLLEEAQKGQEVEARAIAEKKRALEVAQNALEKAQEELAPTITREDFLKDNPYIQQYKRQLDRELQRPESQEQVQESSFAKSAIAWLKSGLKSIQIAWHELVGNKEAANEVRKDLVQIYKDLGKDGLFKKARAQHDLAQKLDDLSNRIETHVDALDSYKKAIDLGTVDQKAIQDEINAAIADLMLIEKELNSPATENSPYITIVAQHIDKILKDFKISTADRVLLKIKIDAPDLKYTIANELTQDDVRGNEKLKQYINEQIANEWKDYPTNLINFVKSKFPRRLD